MKKLFEDENYLSKSKKLFADWFSTLKSGHKKKVLENLNNLKGVFAFKGLVESMGQDGQTLRKFYEEIKEDLHEDSKKSKEIFCKKLVEAVEKDKDKSSSDLADFMTGGLNAEGYEHYAILNKNGGVGNDIDSDIEVTDNGLVSTIIRSIVGGNLAIASQLTMSGWNSLSNGDKMSIFNTAKMQNGYNQAKVVAKDDGEAKYYFKQLEKSIEKGSISKEEFQQKAFPRTDFKFYSLDDK